MARIPSKRQTLLAYLQRGVAMLHLDARRAGVVVPPQYCDDAHLRLNLSYRYSIPDLVVDDERVQCTLSFGGRPFQCVLPWGSIFGITSTPTGDGQVWPEDLPVEVMQTLAEKHERSTAPTPPMGQRPVLKQVVSHPLQQPAAAAEPEAPSKPPDAQDSAPKRHLRLVR